MPKALQSLKTSKTKKSILKDTLKQRRRKRKQNSFIRLLLKGGLVPRQLNLFSAEELAECYLHSVVVRKVRQSLHKEKQKKQKLDNVIKFPIKFVS